MERDAKQYQYTMCQSGPTDDGWTYSRQIPTFHTELSAKQVAELVLAHRPDGSVLDMGMVNDGGYYTRFTWEVSRGQIALMECVMR